MSTSKKSSAPAALTPAEQALALLCEQGLPCPACQRSLDRRRFLRAVPPPPPESEAEQAPAAAAAEAPSPVEEVPPAEAAPPPEAAPAGADRDSYGVPVDALPPKCPREEAYAAVIIPARLAPAWLGKDGSARVRLPSGRTYIVSDDGRASIDPEQHSPPASARPAQEVLAGRGSALDGVARAAGSEVRAAVSARPIGYRAAWYSPTQGREGGALRWARFADAGPQGGSRKKAHDGARAEGAEVLSHSKDLALPPIEG